jgi:hypothetical protein
MRKGNRCYLQGQTLRRARPNPRRVKKLNTYTVEEAARTLGLHRNTIREWVKRGLPTIDCRRPTLILGRSLADFIETRRARNRQPCGPGEFYCMRCRAPRRPAERMADYLPLTATVGNLRGMCPECEALIHRRVSRAKLDALRGLLDIAFPQGQQHIRESLPPSVNCDSQTAGESDADAQR